jgi:hypothetical protein
MDLCTTQEISPIVGISVDRLRKLHQAGRTEGFSKQPSPRGPILWDRTAIKEIKNLK